MCQESFPSSSSSDEDVYESSPVGWRAPEAPQERYREASTLNLSVTLYLVCASLQAVLCRKGNAIPIAHQHRVYGSGPDVQVRGARLQKREIAELAGLQQGTRACTSCTQGSTEMPG